VKFESKQFRRNRLNENLRLASYEDHQVTKVERYTEANRPFGKGWQQRGSNADSHLEAHFDNSAFTRLIRCDIVRD